MKTITTLSKVCINLSIGLALQQFFYGIQYGKWIDFTTWSTTTLGFEALFILSIVFSTISAVTKVSVRPMKSSRTTLLKDIGENIYFQKED
jgi:hypothetical protein